MVHIRYLTKITGNKKGILSLICGVCNSSTVVVIPTKQGCEKGKTF